MPLQSRRTMNDMSVDVYARKGVGAGARGARGGDGGGTQASEGENHHHEVRARVESACGAGARRL